MRAVWGSGVLVLGAFLTVSCGGGGGADPVNPDRLSIVDQDKDGLTDVLENACGSDPRLADTDADDLSDATECNVWHTDPREKDTDGDGVSDGDEVLAGTDPLDPASTDFDRDGWATPEDCDDHNPLVNPGMTDPFDGVDRDCVLWADMCSVYCFGGEEIRVTIRKTDSGYVYDTLLNTSAAFPCTDVVTGASGDFACETWDSQGIGYSVTFDPANSLILTLSLRCDAEDIERTFYCGD